MSFNFETVLIYLNDIVIFFKTFEKHVKHLDQVLIKVTKHPRGSQLEPKLE